MLQLGLLLQPEKSAPVPVQCIGFLDLLWTPFLWRYNWNLQKFEKNLKLCIEAIHISNLILGVDCWKIGLLLPTGEITLQTFEEIENSRIAQKSGRFWGSLHIEFSVCKNLEMVDLEFTWHICPHLERRATDHSFYRYMYGWLWGPPARYVSPRQVYLERELMDLQY